MNKHELLKAKWLTTCHAEKIEKDRNCKWNEFNQGISHIPMIQITNEMNLWGKTVLSFWVAAGCFTIKTGFFRGHTGLAGLVQGRAVSRQVAYVELAVKGVPKAVRVPLAESDTLFVIPGSSHSLKRTWLLWMDVMSLLYKLGKQFIPRHFPTIPQLLSGHSACPEVHFPEQWVAFSLRHTESEEQILVSS